MFLDEVPPDTSVYMIAGYVIFFVITAVYLLSLFIRTRNLGRDLETLEGLEEEQRRLAPSAPPARARARTGMPRSKSGKGTPARKKTSKNKKR